MASMLDNVLANSSISPAPSNHPRDVIATLSTSPQSFLQPSLTLYTATILATKQILDPLADSVRRTQESRRTEARKKKKRSEYHVGLEEPILQLRQIYADGFKVNQIWEQAKRVLDATALEIEQDTGHFGNSTNASRVPATSGLRPTLNGESEISSSGEDGSETDLSDGPGIMGEELRGSTNSTAEETDENESEKSYDIDGEGLEDESRSHFSEEHAPEIFVADRHGLNDGFFSIDQFNRQSQFLEQRDALGESDGAASDEEEVDWSINPLASAPVKIAGNRDKASRISSDISNSDSDEDGPTFDSADAHSSLAEEVDVDGALDVHDAMPGLDNTNEIKYADFFAPPPKVTAKSNKRPLPKTQPTPPLNNVTNLEADMHRAISDVRRDLFEDEEEATSTDDDLQDALPANNLSTHEKQRAKIAREIARLEAANVSQRDWTLSGEARAIDRPVNSLVEEDLDFERTGKPVPVITAEVSEEIEDLIRQRILAKDFDEVIRRRPEAVGAANGIRRGRVDLDDNRPQQTLADLYESDHLAKTDPNYKDSRSEKLKREHTEIERLWKDVSAKLDILSNLNYKPKRPEASVNIVIDAPTITVEDVRPAADVTGVDGRRLAPQEVYNPVQDAVVKKAEEVIRKGGTVVAREEMTREEKLRQRRREKERKKKRTAIREAKRGVRRGKEQETENILKELRKGGVKVIGKKGDVRDTEGRRVRDGIVGSTGISSGDKGRGGTTLKL